MSKNNIWGVPEGHAQEFDQGFKESTKADVKVNLSTTVQSGDSVETRKILGQVVPTPAVLTDLYEVPAATSAEVTTIYAVWVRSLPGTYEYLTNLAGANNDLRYYGDTPGVTIKYTNPGADGALTINTVGHDIEVVLAYATGAITSTASSILTAINADVSASALLTASLKAGNSGAGVVTAMAIQELGMVEAPTFRISVAEAGAVDALAQYTHYNYPLDVLGYSTVLIDCGMMLSAGDVMRVYASIGTVAFSAFGIERVPRAT